MPRYSAASCLLSVLIVALVGFVLHRPDFRPPSAAVNPLTSSEPLPSLVREPPEPTAGVAWSEPPQRVIRTASQTSVYQRVPTRTDGPFAAPRSPFAEVRPGERLEDVARRVYGDERAAARIWEANRDQIRDRLGTLPAGMMLRTPR